MTVVRRNETPGNVKVCWGLAVTGEVIDLDSWGVLQPATRAMSSAVDTKATRENGRLRRRDRGSGFVRNGKRASRQGDRPETQDSRL